MKPMMFVRYFNVVVVLLMCVYPIQAQESGWKCDEHAFEYDMSAFLVLVDENDRMLDMSQYEVAAFVEDECRGVARLERNEDGSEYMYIRIRSHVSEGEIVSFKCYSTSSRKIYGIDNTIGFKERTSAGYPSSPLFLSKVTPEYQVVVDVVGEGTVSGGGFYKEGDTVLLEAVPAEGWRFGSWSDGATTSTYSFKANENKMLTVRFLVNRYVVTFYDEDSVTVIKRDTLDYGAEIVVPDAPKKEGYTFVGWGDMEKNMPAHDLAYYAGYKINKYRVVYLVDGDVYAVDSVYFGAEIEIVDEPSKDGHTFSGWEDVPVTMPANDITIKGSFTVNSYMVTFMIDDKVYSTAIVEFGASIELPTPPEIDGYVFSGWIDVPSTMPAGDIIIKGYYSERDTGVKDVVDHESYEYIYSINGASNVNEGLLKGHIYIIEGKKVLVR